MALSITSNIASLNAQRSLTTTTNRLGETFQRLSSGLRINSAKDDAAGLSISTRMTAQVRGVNQAMRNANDAISLVQVAEGALDETTNALQRMRELAVQAANDTNSPTDRDAIQKEMIQLNAEIDRISTQTKFNGQLLLQGSYAAGKIFHVGADAGQTIQISIANVGLGATALNVSIGGALGSMGTTITQTSGQSIANSMITLIGVALDSVSDIRAQLGAYQNRFEAVISNLSSISENTTAARSRIVDADIAAETANLTKNSILQQAGAAILAQANQQPQLALKLLG